jgi:hypothetical protein
MITKPLNWAQSDALLEACDHITESISELRSTEGSLKVKLRGNKSLLDLLNPQEQRHLNKLLGQAEDALTCIDSMLEDLQDKNEELSNL